MVLTIKGNVELKYINVAAHVHDNLKTTSKPYLVLWKQFLELVILEMFLTSGD